MSFGISKLSAYISGSKIAMAIGVPLTGTLLYHTVKAGAYAGLRCAIDPWKHQTLVDIINLPKALPEFFFQNCKSQVYVTVGSAALTIVTGALTIYFARSKTPAVSVPQNISKTRSVPQIPLPLSPKAELLNDIIKELDSKTGSFDTEGLFRLSGSKTTIDAARDAIIKRQDKSVIATLGPHDLTGLIKELLKTEYLNQLPPATFNEQIYKEQGNTLLESEYLQKLSPLQRETVKLLMQKLLIPIANKHETNKMTEANLLTSFSLSLFVQPPVPTNATLEDLKKLAVDTNAWLFKALLAYYRVKKD